jgi:hypothetical protein
MAAKTAEEWDNIMENTITALRQPDANIRIFHDNDRDNGFNRRYTYYKDGNKYKQIIDLNGIKNITYFEVIGDKTYGYFSWFGEPFVKYDIEAGANQTQWHIHTYYAEVFEALKGNFEFFPARGGRNVLQGESEFFTFMNRGGYSSSLLSGIWQKSFMSVRTNSDGLVNEFVIKGIRSQNGLPVTHTAKVTITYGGQRVTLPAV